MLASPHALGACSRFMICTLSATPLLAAASQTEANQPKALLQKHFKYR
jgi:hypothetical protein